MNDYKRYINEGIAENRSDNMLHKRMILKEEQNMRICGIGTKK